MSIAPAPHPPLPESLAQREATARLLWTGGIIGFFVIQAILWTVAITLTHQDPSHAVLEGYDQRALNWDAWQDTLRASTALGWRADLEVGPPSGVEQRRELMTRLWDRNGQPVTQAGVQLRLFHRARAGEAEVVMLREILPGEYVATFRPQQPGIWKFELTATKGENQFLDFLESRIVSEH